MSARLHRLSLLPLLLAACTQLACPTVTIKSLEVLSKVKDLVTLGATIEVDNGEAYSDPTSSSFVIAAPPGWIIEEVRYRVPGEPLTRRARPATGVAAQADWTYVQPGVSWWGFKTVEHVIPTGIATYTAEINVRVPRKAREGTVVLVVGEPGKDTPVAAYRLALKPKPTLAGSEAPGINPDAIVEAAMGGEGDLGWMFGDGSGDLDGLGQDLGDLGDSMALLGTMLGGQTGEPGHREEWMKGQMAEGRLQLPGLSLVFPEELSAMGDPPVEGRAQLVFFPPGMAYLGGLDVHLAVDDLTASAMYDQEVQTAVEDLNVAGTPPTVEERWVTGASGASMRSTTLQHTEGGLMIETTLMARIQGGTMVLGAAFGDTGGAGATALLEILDSIVYE